jgi:hypothetical protein
MSPDPRVGDRYSLSGSAERCTLGSVDSPLAAFLFGTALLSVVVGARLVVQHQRGTLDWGQERPVLLGSPLIVLSLVAVTAGGPTARAVLPPLVISGLGIALLHYVKQVADMDAARRLRRLAYLSVLSGPLYLVGTLLREFVH